MIAHKTSRVRRSKQIRSGIAGVLAVSVAALPISASANDGEAPLPEPSDREYSLGQSLQIRVNADAEPNSGLANFRWTVNQLVVQSPEDGDVEVPIPEDGDMLRSLIDFGSIPQEDGEATVTVDVENGVGVARTVSLFPQDSEPPIELEAKFTLDGEPISAADLVGKSGVVTAEYTLTNTSTQEMEVEVTNLQGKEVTTTVDADVPMVGLGKQLVPQSWGGLSVKGGAIGADGRGNTQIQYIALPFRPISGDGTATFGWSARVTDAIVPSMLMQVAPIYIPEPDDKNKEKQDEGTAGAGIAGPNLDPALDQVKSGLSQVLAGVETLTSGGGPDPLKVVQGKLNSFFNEFGQNLQTTAELVNPDNPEGATAQVRELQGLVTEAQATIQRIEENDVLDKLERAAGTLTPENAAKLAALAPQLQALVDNIDLISGSVTVYCAIPEKVRPDAPGLGRPLTNAECATLKDGLKVLESQQVQDAIAFLNQISDQLVPASEVLQLLNRQLPGIITTLTPVLATLDSVLATLSDALLGLSTQLQTIGRGLEEKNITLPSLDAVVSEVVSAVLASPGGQDITAGIATLGAGLGDAKVVLGDFLAQVVVAATAAVEKGKKVAANADAAVVSLKASVAGLVMAAHQSPLPYGGDPANAPEGTVLAGAYEFRVDAADGNLPQTLPRILLGVVLLIGAGALGYVVSRRRSAEPVS